ncbi:hypothetical protein B7494_g6161 [Chlorociboria aeruginascens]|nr:hypothetical protein B7494_g6161 [Chlorociboria aeruginascens]
MLSKGQASSKSIAIMPLTLKDHVLRTTYIFQAIVPFASMLSMSAVVFENFNYPSYSMYHFIKSGLSAILAAGIIFIAILQCRRGPPFLTKTITTRLEAGAENSGYGKEQENRIITAAVGSVVLYILYYPTLFYAIVDAGSNEDEDFLQGEEEESLLAHMHCHFLVSGNASTLITYEIDQLHDGKSFAARAVKAKQADRTIFTATVSFTKSGLSAGKKVLHHAASMLQGVREPSLEDQISENSDPMVLLEPQVLGLEMEPARRTAVWWIRTRGCISGNADMDVHLRAVAFMTDNMFIEAIALVHSLPRSWRDEQRGKIGKIGNKTGNADATGVVRLKQDELSKTPSSSRL